jgi:ketosteroid isomerase-like protein
MLARTPQEAVDLADAAFNRGDLDGMLAFYEDGAVMLFAPGQLVLGKTAIRDLLKTLLGAKPVATHDRSYVIQWGDLALWTSAWSVRGTGPDGTPLAQTGRSSVIFRRGTDGGWRVVVENPWGSAVLDWSQPAANG